MQPNPDASRGSLRGAACCRNDSVASLPRRDFLRLGSLAAGGLAMAGLPVVAGPFTRQDFEKLVPADKKLSPAWVQSLFARGEREAYRGAELEKIGLPIGGLCAGQVYLGGDGKLWHWDIFNQPISTGAEHYAQPMPVKSPLDQGFALRITTGGRTQVRPLDRAGWRDITFIGEYPFGFVEYRDPAAPVAVSLEAFSPFVPLNVDDSSLPATILRWTLRNTGAEPLELELGGWLENAVGLRSGTRRDLQRRNRLVRRETFEALECSAEPPPQAGARPARPEIVFDDFEREGYAPWVAEGTAFGSGPIEQDQLPAYQGKVGGQGRRVVNSHATAPGDTVAAKDAATGTLTSRPFVIERDYITFLIGGGAHAGRTCVNLLVEDQVVLSATGANENRLQPHTWDVRRWVGKTARLQVVDRESGAWGNIGLDDIRFSDQPRPPLGPLAEEPDLGTLVLALLQPTPADRLVVGLPAAGVPAGLFAVETADLSETATAPFGRRLIGSLARRLTLAPGEAGEVVFVLAWHFPNLKMDRLPPGRHYGTRFASALAVVEHLAGRYPTLRELTHRWHATWYDSTLPYWFLNRTFLNTSILATSTCVRLANGRFWGWEGVGCCAGTCGHVWQYAQAVARLFPALERDTRERVDFGLALQADGAIHFRGEFNNIPAVDGQAGTILRALREHHMTSENTWLQRNWPNIKRALAWLIAKDGDGNGLIEGSQHNTLDTDWHGPVAWLSGLYLAALRAGEEMARIVGDTAFATRCREIFERGQRNLVKELFDGEYFINKPDPKRPEAINSGTGCHIDQVLGQSWAWQVGLGRVLPAKETVSALRALWRYNFTPDVGPYRAVYKPGRWYAMPGEGGLLMCTFPRADWDYAQARGKGPDWAAGYFNECMNGFEYQVAGHCLAEGLVLEGLAITRMIHDRYHPLRRNPWNEIECGDHYARSMASYGVFLAACGYEYDGPRGHLGFAPRLTPEDFRCAFTTAEGWGTFRQKAEDGRQTVALELKWGQLRLHTLALAPWPGRQPTTVATSLNGHALAATLSVQDGKAVVRWEGGLRLQERSTLIVTLA